MTHDLHPMACRRASENQTPKQKQKAGETQGDSDNDYFPHRYLTLHGFLSTVSALANE
jgi:hypothetical protein